MPHVWYLLPMSNRQVFGRRAGRREVMSELQEIQRAGAKVIEDFTAAYQRGEVTDYVLIAARLTTVALMMKPAYRLAGLKLAHEYADLVGLDARYDRGTGACPHLRVSAVRVDREGIR